MIPTYRTTPLHILARATGGTCRTGAPTSDPGLPAGGTDEG